MGAHHPMTHAMIDCERPPNEVDIITTKTRTKVVSTSIVGDGVIHYSMSPNTMLLLEYLPF